MIEVPDSEVFSFWKHIGRAKKRSGYAVGRELRQGCLIPTVGGGLCQLSNALYELALKCGCEIIERHAHTAVVPGSAAERGHDATVFWNYVDLRFRPKQDILIRAVLSKDEVIMSFWGKQKLVPIVEIKAQSRERAVVNTCTDCGVAECFRHVDIGHSRQSGRVAFLIEECWPEFEGFAREEKFQESELFLPFHSRAALVGRYAWDTDGYARVVSANFRTALSSIQARFGRGSTPAIALQLRRSATLASYYGERISIDISHVYVTQTLLPFLWRKGDLGGRSFSVFMTRWPLQFLHRTLNDLASKFPERRTFQEFRAPAWMVEAETEALERADRIVTPHRFLAGLFPSKTKLLDWKLPPTKLRKRGHSIAFPGPSVARKGAFELRDSLRTLDYPLMVLNRHAVEPELWDGVRLEPVNGDWLDQAAVVVQPAFLENNPRTLLRALAAGIPVIATQECGIGTHPLLALVPAGDTAALTHALRKTMSELAILA